MLEVAFNKHQERLWEVSHLLPGPRGILGIKVRILKGDRFCEDAQ